MRKLTMLLAALAVFFMLTGCAASITYQPRGAPLGFYVDETGPLLVTENQLGQRRGEACSQSILGLVVTGDSSVGTAARNGGITRIGAVDARYQNVIGIMATYCTIVYGD